MTGLPSSAESGHRHERGAKEELRGATFPPSLNACHDGCQHRPLLDDLLLFKQVTQRVGGSGNQGEAQASSRLPRCQPSAPGGSLVAVYLECIERVWEQAKPWNGEDA